ncbi:MAG: NfeD family protein [Nitrospirales bacterium]|nr:NfeD family protein [Nitrospira sp.]MDR4501417.1 NfeD family protein [Nitrospirales bacterium]
MTWWYWALLGFAFLGIEILTLGGLGNFYFLFFGTAALVVSAIVWMGLAEVSWIQWVLFATLGVLSLLVLRGPLQRKFIPKGQENTTVDSLLGEIATVLEDLPRDGAGKVELHGSTWTACNAGETLLHRGQRTEVVRVDGLTLWIKAESPMKEEQHVG